LLQNGSNYLLFALFSYMGKYPTSFVKSAEPWAVVMEVLGKWELKEFNLRRQGSEPFQNYVTKTIMATIGVLMKYLYENVENSVALLVYLENMPLNFFKIYTLKAFIETV